VRDACNRALQRPDGPGLGLENDNIYVYWEHQSGMRLCHFIETIHYMNDRYPKPDLLIIHCGGNDIGLKPIMEIIMEGKTLYKELKVMLPYTRLIWSQILPRKSWRYIENVVVADKNRKRINSSLSTFFIKQGGRTIKYPDITNVQNMFKSDGTHLSVLGCDLMLNTLSGAIYTFYNSQSVIFPE
jgi:hypothetical protein